MKDAIHGFIPISDKCMKLIDTPLFQRLDYVRQLTSAQYVFPCAHHTRKSHCIGAMHIASKYIRSILNHPNTTLNYREYEKEEIIEALEMTALLHDISHGPYSHSWDATIFSKLYNENKGHDQHRYALLDQLFIDKSLSKKDVQIISKIWSKKIPALSAIVGGPISCDRMDFLKRDSYFTGCDYGCFDIDRIISNCWFETLEDCKKDEDIILVYDAKTVKSIIQGLSTRIYMYEEVYLHKTVIAAAVLIEAMILEALPYLNYIERTKDNFLELTDGSVFHEILSSTSKELEKAREHANNLCFRKLPKMIFEKKCFEVSSSHREGIQVEDGKAIWVSRVLSNDFISDFEKYNIHIRKDRLYTFRDYCKEEYIKVDESKYYFERVYAF